jgi:uncharacterized protein (DUF302 family)
MSKQVGARHEVLEFTGKRIRYFSARSFDEVLARLRSRMGKINMADVFDPSGSKEDFEREVQKHTGESGFMLFVEMNHGAWIKNFGIQRRLVRWIFGNPLVAITMLRHDYTAGLFVPPDLLLAESDDGTGCNVTYVLPSSLIAIEANAALSSACLDLDAKVEALVISAVA